MDFDILWANIHLGGSGKEVKTLHAFSAVTQEVIEEIDLVEPLGEMDQGIGVTETISQLDEMYPLIGHFILDRVVEQLKASKRHPVYEITPQEDTVEKTA